MNNKIKISIVAISIVAVGLFLIPHAISQNEEYPKAKAMGGVYFQLLEANSSNDNVSIPVIVFSSAPTATLTAKQEKTLIIINVNISTSKDPNGDLIMGIKNYVESKGWHDKVVLFQNFSIIKFP